MLRTCSSKSILTLYQLAGASQVGAAPPPIPPRCLCRRAVASRGDVCKLTSCTHIVQASIRRVLATSGSLVVAPTTRFCGWTCLPSSTPTFLAFWPAGRYNGRHSPALFLVPESRGRHSLRYVTFWSSLKWRGRPLRKAAAFVNPPVAKTISIKRGNARADQSTRLRTRLRLVSTNSSLSSERR